MRASKFLQLQAASSDWPHRTITKEGPATKQSRLHLSHTMQPRLCHHHYLQSQTLANINHGQLTFPQDIG